MNCKQANEIPIRDVIELIGGVKEGVNKADSIWYPSPFRSEKKPSFRIDLQSNRWKDFGKPGKNEGTVVDFVMELKNCSINEALALIEEHTLFTRGQIKASFSSFQEHASPLMKNESENFVDMLGEKISRKNELSDNLEILNVCDLKNIALLDYVSSRKIDLVIAKHYLKEIYFRNNKLNKTYFALGFKNDSGAFEYRNKYLGGVIGHKDITTINEGNSKLAIFEGFFDFLTYLTIEGKIEAPRAVYVLNSVNLTSKAVSKIRESRFEEINLYLDNDTAGDQTTEIFISEFADLISDERKIFEGYKDYNDFLQKSVKP